MAIFIERPLALAHCSGRYALRETAPAFPLPLAREERREGLPLSRLRRGKTRSSSPLPLAGRKDEKVFPSPACGRGEGEGKPAQRFLLRSHFACPHPRRPARGLS